MARTLRITTTQTSIGLAVINLLLVFSFPAILYYEKPQYKEVAGRVTAYSSEVGQTDDNPFETANGETVGKGTLANNCLKFGTKVVINSETYQVNDRMNKRYGCQDFDIWFEDTQEALNFGEQLLIIKIYGGFSKKERQNLQKRRGQM